MNEQHDLLLLLRSRVAIITISTHEEKRAVQLIRQCAKELQKQAKLWSVTKGMVDLINNRPALSLANKSSQDEGFHPKDVLREISSAREPSIFVLADFRPYLDDNVIARGIKELALEHQQSGHIIIMLGTSSEMVDSLQPYTASFELYLPDKPRVEKLVEEEIAIWRLKNSNADLTVDDEAVGLLVENLSGITETDARRLIHNAIVKDQAILHSDVGDVQKAKHELLGQDGLLSFEYETSNFKEVGGLNRLKRWLEVRKAIFLENDEAKSLDKPKGILLVGVQGGGKSLAAKAVAGVYGVPLMRLDFGSLYNKFFGESEKNMRHALKLAEIMSPCVLWIDEIEKGISSGDYDSGTSQRILGTMLTWMAENEKSVFIVATANKIDALPPELIRKGRLDEIFFVDLPDSRARAEIFEIHLKKRNAEHGEIDYTKLADACEGFTGAEIEQCVVSALYLAYALKRPTTTAMLIEEINQTKPLSVVMAEQIAALRDWAHERTVLAD